MDNRRAIGATNSRTFTTANCLKKAPADNPAGGAGGGALNGMSPALTEPPQRPTQTAIANDCKQV